jgi:hypothetical protein
MGGLPQAQYSVHSSANPSASGIKYDPLRYGLKPGKYRVKHFGHSTQWRTREAMARVGELLRGKLAACAHPSGTPRRAGALGLRCGPEASVGPHHEVHAAAVEERPITRHRHQRRPTVVIPIPRWCRCYSTRCFLSSMSAVSDWTLVDMRPNTTIQEHRPPASWRS